jgi:predicted transcriptional regulator
MDSTLPTPQEQLRRVVDEQPADSSYEEIVREVAFAAMVERGLVDARAGRVSTHDEMRNAIESWQK